MAKPHTRSGWPQRMGFNQGCFIAGSRLAAGAKPLAQALVQGQHGVGHTAAQVVHMFGLCEPFPISR